MNYLIVSTSVIDEVFENKKTDSFFAVGGAGSYALAGAKIWEDNVKVSCGKGIDFKKYLEPFFIENKINDECMFETNLNTPITKVVYDEFGERIETPVYGKDHYSKFISSISFLEKNTENLDGLYIFKEAYEIDFFKKLIKLSKKNKFKIMWEISADTAIIKYLNNVKELSKDIDMFSINISEACSLFNCKKEECEKNLQSLGFKFIYFRKGSKGATIISKDQIINCPPAFEFEKIDATGAGNASTGAVMIGYCQNLNLNRIGWMGSISAGAIISQMGIPNVTEIKLRNKCKSLLKEKEESDARLC